MRPFACDGVLIENGKVLLIKRGRDPFKGHWATPGGRIEDNESAEECLVREMEEETGLKVEPVKLIGLYSDPKRDPRLMIAAAYLIRRVSGDVRSGDDAAEARWFSLDDLPPMCTDHPRIVRDAVALLREMDQEDE
jgi:8-oxo-dGTP diphosphatase